MNSTPRRLGLPKSELRRSKSEREAFRAKACRPILVVLDWVTQA